MDVRTRRAGRWAAGAALWIAGLAAVTPLVDRFPLVPVVGAIVRSAPGALATAAIELLGKSAQPLLVAGVVAGVPLLAAAVGAVLGDDLPWGLGPGLLVAATFGLLAWDASAATAVTAVATGLAVLPVGLVAILARRRAVRHGIDYTRRGALKRGAAGVAAAAAVAGVTTAADRSRNPDDGIDGGEPLPEREKRATGRTVARTSTATPSDDGFGFDFQGMPRRVEPINTHYVVDIATNDPSIDADGWSLDVTGLVEEPYALGLDDLLTHEARTSRVVTMVCISNPVGGELISTTRWHGVPIAALLDRAGVREGAVDVVTRAADGYSEAMPLETARREGVMIAVGADGKTLPRSHGFPARLLLPGRYGMKSTKWVTGIEVAGAEHDAFWERRGWDEAAVINTLSYVRAGERRGDRAAVGGIAYAGRRGIERVEVSVDGGPWREADLEAAPSSLAWRRWRHVFPAGGRTRVEVAVRAVDGTGERQPRERTGPHPGGSTGWHRRGLGL